MTIVPRVIDISHYDNITDRLHGAKAMGIWGVIHKCTEAYTYDHLYNIRRQYCRETGLLWGAYHFIRPGSAGDQAEFFVHHAQPDAATLLAIDYEDNSVGLAAARLFVEAVEHKTARRVVVYSGNTIKEKLGGIASPFWGSRRLWLAQYSAHPTLQASWRDVWLWQYTGDGAGLPPHHVPGIEIAGGCDINSYTGSREQLTADWAGLLGPPTTPRSLDPALQHGRGSWFSQYQGKHHWVDHGDQPGSSALGVPDQEQGVAFYSHSTLGRWFEIHAPNGTISIEQQTDVGPNPNTGRRIDISAVAAERLGYAPTDFPTGAVFGWRNIEPPASVAGLTPRLQAAKYYIQRRIRQPGPETS